MKTLHWFRDDLRLHDNTALHHAVASASNMCLAVYFITPQTWREHDMAACKVDFILRGLECLAKELAQHNIVFIVQQCDKFTDIPAALSMLCQKHEVQAVFANEQYEINEKLRDKQVRTTLLQKGIAFHTYPDQCIIAPGEVKTQKGTAFTVFTPFKKAWLAQLEKNPVCLLPLPSKKLVPILEIPAIPTAISGFHSTIDPTLWPAGEEIAQKQLTHFIQHTISAYDKTRDIPSIEGTSRLSPYLATGMISARQCLSAALVVNKGQLNEGNQGVLTWINELIWRDFYKHILVQFPRVCRYQPFKLETNSLIWDNNLKLLEAWQQGKTGFPIVDAAMRQLQQTGWMHNRLRMLTAMFFSKLLWLDWREGEKFFMQHLIDGDLSANNGGWQWSASTGTDAAPYFRVFNPLLQSERYDPDGIFIRQYCPELNELDHFAIHAPYERAGLFAGQLNYPRPIIDYKQAREHAIQMFKAARS